MECTKVAFKTIDEANRRANEINNENKKNKDKIRLRPYSCKDCGEAHLSSMSKRLHMHCTSEESRIDIRKNKADAKRKIFVENEAEHWEDKFGL